MSSTTSRIEDHGNSRSCQLRRTRHGCHGGPGSAGGSASGPAGRPGRSALRLPIKVSSATSDLMIGITASASAGAFFLRGEVVPAIDGPVAVGSVVGALFGARVLIAMSAERLRTLFILLLLLLLAALMALGASGIDIVRGAS